MGENYNQIDLERELKDLRKEKEEILNSTSWKIACCIQKLFVLFKLDKVKNAVDAAKSDSPAASSAGVLKDNLPKDEFAKAVEKLVSEGKAELDSPSGVNLMSANFFKDDGTTYYSGGAERYILDLHKICAEIGHRYTVYQFGAYDWVRFYGNLEVRSIHLKSQPYGCSEFDCEKFQNEFIRATEGSSVLNIYSPFFHTARKDPTRSIGISHGIGWDAMTNKYLGPKSIVERIDGIVRTNRFCDEIVSVDTNTANWFQTMDYEMGHNMVYVPNYVDVDEFIPHKKGESEPTVILYARRMYAPRGLYIMLDLVDDILEKYPNVKFRFVGKGFEEDTKHIEEKIEKWQDRVEWYSLAPDKMHTAYEDADISVIPTLWSEGTSLSCLESLASGNAVIATRIGGLCDIIVDGYNGRLVEPTASSVREAIVEMLDNREVMNAYKTRGRESALTFNKSKWNSRWKSIFAKNLIGVEPIEPVKFKRIQVKAVLENLDIEGFAEKVSGILETGAYVFVSFADIEQNPYRFLSNGRLQFIDRDEDLYFDFEETVEF